MAFTYDKSSVVTERTPIPLPEVEPVIHATYILVNDQPDGLIIDMDAEPRSDGVAGSPAGGSGDFVRKNHRAKWRLSEVFIIFTPNIKLSGLLWQI